MSYLIQNYRGIAALLVVLFHTSGMTKYYFLDESYLTWLFEFGHAGVEFFFVLSGFIIYRIHRVDFSTPSRVYPYFLKRIIRIYPIYILLTLLLLPFWLIFDSSGEQYHREIMPLIKSLFLIPQSHFPHIGVAWTLTHEMLFYITFSLFIINKKIGAFFIILWMMMIVVNIDTDNYLARFFFSRHNFLFFMGGVISYIMLKYDFKNKNMWLFFILGNLTFLASGLFFGAQEDVISTIAFGLSSCLILFGVENHSIEKSMKKNTILGELGNSSYSIYLTHTFFLSFLCKFILFFGINNFLPVSAIYILIAMISVVFGYLVYFYIEKLMLKKIRTYV
jgi:exopolysaccharide production protein ExoZ